MKVFSDKQINSIKRDLQLWIGDEAAKSFDASKDKAKWFQVNQDALLTNDQFIKKYDIDALISVDTKPMESLYNRYPNFDKLTENQIKRFTNSTDISKDELKKYYDFANNTKERNTKYNEERYKELDKNRQEAERAKEYDDSFYDKYLANEYARKHYIQGHPNQATVNEVAGKAAALADYGPPLFALAGPTIRTAQKWAADEPVLTMGTVADFGGGALGFVGKIPGIKQAIQGTTGKIANLLTRSKNPRAQEIANVINKKAIAEEEEMARRELANLKQVGDLDKLTQDELYKLYNSTGDPVLKSNIEKVHKARQELEYAREIHGHPNVAGNNTAANQAADNVLLKDAALEQANNDVTKNMADYEAFLQAKSGDINFSPYGDIPSFFKDVPMEVVAEQYARKQKPSFLSKALGEVILGIGRKTAGQTVAHRNWNEIDYKPDYNEDKAINEIIRLYSNDWKYGKPSNYNEPLIKAAYDKWLNDQYMKGNYDVLYRMGEI